MPLTRLQKQKIINDLKEKISRQKSIVLVDIAKIKVKDLAKLRKLMRKEDCELKVAKKTLIQLALGEKKVETDVKKLEGEIALVFGYQDEISPFRISYDFSKEVESLKILAGFFEKEFINKEKAIELATLSTKEELLAKLVGSIASPISGLANVLQANIKGLIYVLSKIKA